MTERPQDQHVAPIGEKYPGEVILCPKRDHLGRRHENTASRHAQGNRGIWPSRDRTASEYADSRDRTAACA